MSIFNTYTPEKLENHLAQFIVGSWSFSKVQTFSRNPKIFEMENIYGYRSRSSASSVAGNAYHKALEYYFAMLKNCEELPDLVLLEQIAFEYIENLDANYWKIQKTTPSVADCIISANKTVSSLLQNFLKDITVYVDDIEEVLEIEFYGKDVYVTVNGVDIPIPLAFRTDLIVRTTSGKIVIIDHKSKGQYTNEADIKLTAGKQAVTYIIGYETLSGTIVDEVWFIENKYTQNRDKSPQLVKFVLEFDKDAKRYYEAMLYESLRGMIQAVNDPDYVYIMNDSDSFIDLAEMYEFWHKTLTLEVEDFNIDPSKKELIKNRLKKIKDSSIKTINPKVLKQFREQASEFIQYDYSNKNMTQEEKIEHVLRGFGTVVKVAKVFNGYSSNTLLLEAGAGTKLSSIASHKLDLANALDVSSVRVGQSLKVLENKAYLPIEVSKKRERDLLFDKKDLVGTKIPIGKDNFENVIIWDYNNQSTPHVVVCGGSGSGKSVEVRSMIEYGLLSGVDQIEVFDLKNEFSDLKESKKISIFREIEDIEKRAKELVDLMNERIKLKISKPIFVIVEEFADLYLMMSKGKSLDIIEEVQDGFYAPKKMKGPFGDYMSDPMPKMKMKAVGRKNTVEENIQSLLQKGRSSGFHLIMATQRADAKTISGSAKVNLTVQICFRVQKATDSIVVLDEPGAESLAGGGDFLLKSPEYQEVVRGQAYWKP